VSDRTTLHIGFSAALVAQAQWSLPASGGTTARKFEPYELQ
jgi:hypothetical protein